MLFLRGKKKKKMGKKIPGSSNPAAKKKKEIPAEADSTGPLKKTQSWFVKIFFNFLYYRSDKEHHLPAKNYPKVKIPRSRHK
jgi:hypothetical protein